ncbi:MAG: hemolysin III family protein [Acidimicrobiales bacterium]
MIGLFSVSAVYHRVFWGTRAEGVFRRLDHAMIFVFIAATYTPIGLATLDPSTQKLVLGLVWFGALAGALRSRLLDWWPALAVGGAVSACRLGNRSGYWPGGSNDGGRSGPARDWRRPPTIGALIYATKAPNPFPRWFGFHEVFHLLVICAIAATTW